MGNSLNHTYILFQTTVTLGHFISVPSAHPPGGMLTKMAALRSMSYCSAVIRFSTRAASVAALNFRFVVTASLAM
jgi:hypothetical protein